MLKLVVILYVSQERALQYPNIPYIKKLQEKLQGRKLYSTLVPYYGTIY